MWKWNWPGGKLGFNLVSDNTRISMLENVSSIQNKMCALEVFKTLKGVSPDAFQNYFT